MLYNREYSKELIRRHSKMQRDHTLKHVIFEIWQKDDNIFLKNGYGWIISGFTNLELADYVISDKVICSDPDLLEFIRMKTL